MRLSGSWVRVLLWGKDSCTAVLESSYRKLSCIEHNRLSHAGQQLFNFASVTKGGSKNAHTHMNTHLTFLPSEDIPNPWLCLLHSAISFLRWVLQVSYRGTWWSAVRTAGWTRWALAWSSRAIIMFLGHQTLKAVGWSHCQSYTHSFPQSCSCLWSNRWITGNGPVST